jgi:hypothetical protein
MADLPKELTVKFLSVHPQYVKVALSVIDNRDFIRANLIAAFAEDIADELGRTFKPEDGWEVTNSISAALRAGEYKKMYTGSHLRKSPWPPDCYVAIKAAGGMAANLTYGI